MLRKSTGWETVIRVKHLLEQQGIRGWVVGGWLRDSLLERMTRDIDFAVAGNGLETARRVAEVLGGRYVMLDKENGVGRVILKPGGEREHETGLEILDFTTLNGASIEEDLSHRDFTIDAIAAEPGSEESSNIQILDPFKGLYDLGKKVIRATNEKVFEADPVRLLRAVRLAAQLDFLIEPETTAGIKKEAGRLPGVAEERIHEELVRLLTKAGSGRYLAYLDELGLLTGLFPELEIARDTKQPPEHYWEVLRHSLETVKAFDFILHEHDWEYGSGELQEAVPWQQEYRQYFLQEVGSGSNRTALFRLAALLHDVAKPQTKTLEPGGRIRFLGHAREGAETARRIMERLRFSNRETRLVEAAVTHHMRPTQMGWPELPSKRAVYRFYRDAGEAAVGVLFLSLADHLATCGPTLDRENWRVHTSITRHILSQKTEMPRPENWLVDGYDIMSRFDLKPGWQVGELLESVHEAQAAGQVATKDEALSFVGNIIKGHLKPGRIES
jgi:poly(A) polymerase